MEWSGVAFNDGWGDDVSEFPFLEEEVFGASTNELKVRVWNAWERGRGASNR